MPSATFYNLPEEKRRELIYAIKEELSRVSFEDVSINKIIHSAGISRGSFYQYFENKIDMIDFILGDYRRKLMKSIKLCLQKSNGDIFTMFNKYLDFTIEYVMLHINHSFFVNLFADIRVSEKFISKGKNSINILSELKPYINTDILSISSDEDLLNMIDILSTIVRDTIGEIFLNMDIVGLIRDRYNQKWNY